MERDTDLLVTALDAVDMSTVSAVVTTSNVTEVTTTTMTLACLIVRHPPGETQHLLDPKKFFLSVVTLSTGMEVQLARY